MAIWVDADACPKVIREVLFRASRRTGVGVTLVANQPLATPPSPHIRAVQVSNGFDVADNYIAQQVTQGDLVVTADIPLAAEVVAKGALAVNPRGARYTEENIKQRLSVRNFMEEMRSTGQVQGGPPPLAKSDVQAFANALDQYLAKSKR